MGKFNIMVVEDESIVAKDIQQSLKKLGYNVVDICSTADSAVASAKEKKPDLILMDIMLKGDKSGIDAAEEIKEELNTPVVFLTAYADESTLNKAKITEPYGYIIKPFKEVELNTTIEMAIYKHGKVQEMKKERDLLYAMVESQNCGDILFIRSNAKYVKINLQEITYIEALKDYVTIHTVTDKYVIHSTMKDIENKLPSAAFIRAHRSFIVRIDKIYTFDHMNLTMEHDKKVIPVGGLYKDALIKKLNFL